MFVKSGEIESEQAALKRLGRDPEAICLIYDRYVLRLVGFLQQEGATPEVAWDAAQETFARLLRAGRRRAFRPPIAVWPWLAASGRNLLRDWARRGIIDTRARRRLGIGLQSAAEIDDLLARLEAREEGNRLAEALGSLAADQRTAIVEHVLDDHDYAEVAAHVGVSEQTVRKRVSRGLRRMRGLLNEGGS